MNWQEREHSIRTGAKDECIESPNPILLQDLFHLTSGECACVEAKLTIHSGHENPLRSSDASLNNQLLFWDKKRKRLRDSQLVICLVRIEDVLRLLPHCRLAC